MDVCQTKAEIFSIERFNYYFSLPVEFPNRPSKTDNTYAASVLAQRKLCCNEKLTVKTMRIINLSTTAMQNNPGWAGGKVIQ